MKQHIITLLLLLCGYFLHAQEYISISPNPCTIEQEGGTYTFAVEYTPSPDSLDRLDFINYSSSSAQINSVTQSGSKELTITFNANSNPSLINGTMTVYFIDPRDRSNQIYGTLSFAQQAGNPDYTLKIAPTSVSFNAQGGSQTFQVSYVYMQEPVQLTYLGSTGLPDGCTITAKTNGVIELSCSRNSSNIARNATITLKYANPLNSTSPITVSFSLQQDGLDYSLVLDPNSLSISPSGESFIIHASIAPYDTAYVIHLHTIEGLPNNVSWEAWDNGGGFIITFPANMTGQALSGVATVAFTDPQSTDALLYTNLSYEQPSYTIPTQEDSKVIEYTYRNESGNSYNTSVNHLDGLGRTIQMVNVGASPQGGDLISFVTYDCMGRSDSVSYLPYVRTTSGIGRDATPVSSQHTFYAQKFGSNAANYAKNLKRYDRGLGLVEVANTPGEAHNLTSGYYTRYTYRLNTTADAIKRYVVLTNGSLQSQGVYEADQLTVYRTLNAQDGNSSQQQENLEYTDALGRTIASEVRVSDQDRRITYYVYDDLNRLRYILPPMADTYDCSTPKTAQQLGDYCYYSEYDERGNIIKSQNPGAEYSLAIYDRRGRLAMSQSGKQRINNEWSFTKYDVFDRPVLSGIITGGTYESHKAALDAATVFYEERGTTVHGYTNQSYPSVPNANSYLTVTYYDDYDWLAANDPHAFSTADALGQTHTTDVVGLTTGVKNKVLGISTDQWLTTVTYYDHKYQTIQAISDLYPSGTEITSNTHDFLGNVTQTKVKQSVGGSTYEYNKWFNYDNFGRLLSIQQQITGDASNGKVTLASYTYDNLGNVASKSIHNGAETETYTYDLNGRVIASTSPSFSYTLDYEQSDLPGATPRLDGQITALRWGAGQTPNRAYAYTYDPVGQLSAAAYKTATNGTWSASNAYAEKNLTYDRHGNIKTLQRTDANGSVLHELSDMTYTGNKLQSLKLNGGSPVNYAYDQNGNITSDGRRGVTINYNILNFPEQIIAGNQQVSYIYSAAGEKLATNANGSLTYYRSVMVYGNDNKLLHILTPEGTVSRTEGSAGTSYTYNYFKKDQIGSTRAVLSAVGNSLQNVQSTDYYPFGLAYSTNNLNKNKYLFSGKELQDASIGGTILGLYDFGARQYDPVIGRWMSIDLLANKFPDVSPFVYCLNNPINLVDLYGLEPIEDSTDTNWWNKIHYLMNIEISAYNSLNTALYETINPTRAELLMWYVISHSMGLEFRNNIGNNNNPISPDGGAPSAGNRIGNNAKSAKNKLSLRQKLINKSELFRKQLINQIMERINRTGRLTFRDATLLWRYGYGQDVTVDINTIDLSRVNLFDIKNGKISVNLFGHKHFHNLNDGLVYGTITLIQSKENPFEFKGADDRYDFDIQLDGSVLRNIGTTFGHEVGGWGGTPFTIHFEGTVKITR